MKANKNINQKTLTILLASLFLFVPLVTSAASVFVPIVPQGCAESQGNANPTGGCGWNDLLLMGQNILQDGIVLVAILSVISITYAGYLYATSGGSDSQIKKAHQVFEKVIWGIFITLGAWLIVKSILGWLGVDSSWTLLQ